MRVMNVLTMSYPYIAVIVDRPIYKAVFITMNPPNTGINVKPPLLFKSSPGLCEVHCMTNQLVPIWFPIGNDSIPLLLFFTIIIINSFFKLYYSYLIFHLILQYSSLGSRNDLLDLVLITNNKLCSYKGFILPYS